MFEGCYKCGIGGLECQDDYASLKSGHWWKWRNKTQKGRYKDFIKNLLAPIPSLNASNVHYPFPIPMPYQCQVEEACKGGLDSPCEKGYEGPICSICSMGYYKQLQICTICLSKKLIVGQLSIIAVVVLIIIAVAVWTNRRKIKNAQGHQQIDMFLSKIKIAIGFYQVTYGLLQVFSYIKWPGSLQVIAKYSGMLQLNVFQIAPIECVFPEFKVDAFGNLFAMMAVNAAVICFSGIAYGVQKLMIIRNRNLEDNEMSRRVSESKAFVYKNLFFFLYVTYLSTCSSTANVLPLACRELCRDEKEAFCSKYLKADYSVRCQDKKFNQLVVMAYISTAYIFALPAATFIALCRQRKQRSVTEYTDASQDPVSHSEINAGLRFLFQNYKSSSWYWELVEMTRKVILTSGLILVGQESRSYIGLALVIAGMYGVLFATIRPMQDATENRMMTTSLAVTFVNLAIGAVSKIPTEKVTGWTGPDVDALVFKILVLGANTLVIGLLLGKSLINNRNRRTQKVS